MPIICSKFLFLVGMIAFQAAGATSLSQIAPLDAADKAALAGALLLKAEVGEEIWPGFGRAEIPAVIYDDISEYLFGEPHPPAPWQGIDGDDFQGKPYFVRRSQNPQSFAVDLGRRWAGSLSAMSRLNRKIPLKLGPDWYALALVHELFHAFQAETSPEAFSAARAVYALESEYPLMDPEFIKAWNAEGAALSRAANAPSEEAARAAAAAFLRMRDARRKTAGLSARLIDYERKLEWLEGLAKYAEIRADELAVVRAGRESFGPFRKEIHFLVRADMARLENALGRQDGDLRFYLSGMAIGRILDRLDPSWKKKALEINASLEGILRAFLKGF